MINPYNHKTVYEIIRENLKQALRYLRYRLGMNTTMIRMQVNEVVDELMKEEREETK